MKMQGSCSARLHRGCARTSEEVRAGASNACCELEGAGVITFLSLGPRLSLSLAYWPSVLVNLLERDRLEL